MKKAETLRALEDAQYQIEGKRCVLAKVMEILTEVGNLSDPVADEPPKLQLAMEGLWNAPVPKRAWYQAWDVLYDLVYELEQARKQLEEAHFRVVAPVTKKEEKKAAAKTKVIPKTPSTSARKRPLRAVPQSPSSEREAA